jgi:hypothetical protein
MRRSVSVILAAAGLAWLSLVGSRLSQAEDGKPRGTLRVRHGNALAVAFARRDGGARVLFRAGGRLLP